MRRLMRLGQIAMVVAVGVVAANAALTVTAKAKPPGGCECANIDNPVICSNGKVYINPCVASCFGATGCVPYGGGGGPP